MKNVLLLERSFLLGSAEEEDMAVNKQTSSVSMCPRVSEYQCLSACPGFCQNKEKVMINDCLHAGW